MSFLAEWQAQQKALKDADRDTKKNTSAMLGNYKGGEHDIKEHQKQHRALKVAELDRKKNASKMLHNYKGGEHDVKDYERAVTKIRKENRENAKQTLSRVSTHTRGINAESHHCVEETQEPPSVDASNEIPDDSSHQASEIPCNPQTIEVIGDPDTKDTAKQKASDESDSTSDSTHTTRPLSVDDDNPPPQTEGLTNQEVAPVDNNKDDKDDSSEQSMAEPPAKEPVELEVKNIRGTDDGVLIELGDGNSVTLTPNQVQQLFSEQNGLLGTENSPESSPDNATENSPDNATENSPDNATDEAPKSNDATDEAPKSNDANKEEPKSNNATDEAPKSNDANDEAPKSNDAKDEEPKSMRKIMIREGVIVEVEEKALRRSTMSLLSGSEMFDVSQSTFFEEEAVASKPPKKSKRQMKSKKTNQSRKSMSLLSTTDLESSESYDDDSVGSKKTKKTKKPKKPKRKSVKSKRKSMKSNKKKSLLDDLDSLSDDSSTEECMTNLIDPGDVMKIYGFQKKPKMNGATVEAIRKSKGAKGARWDVRVISEEHYKHVSAKRLISVSSANLKHFM